MPPPRTLDAPILGLICIALALGLAWLAYGWVGGLGVATLGVLVLFIAIRVDLERNRPVGHQMTPDLYASQHRAESQEHASERAGRLIRVRALVSATRVAIAMGLLLVAAGSGLMMWGEAYR